MADIFLVFDHSDYKNKVWKETCIRKEEIVGFTKLYESDSENFTYEQFEFIKDSTVVRLHDGAEICVNVPYEEFKKLWITMPCKKENV